MVREGKKIAWNRLGLGVAQHGGEDGSVSVLNRLENRSHSPSELSAIQLCAWLGGGRPLPIPCLQGAVKPGEHPNTLGELAKEVSPRNT